MCTADPSNPELHELLLGYLAGDERCRELLPKVGRPYLLKLARRHASDLPPDLQEEVFQQTLMNLLLVPATSFNPERGAAGTYLKMAIQTAARQVRAANAPPGVPKRRRGPAVQPKKLTAAAPAPTLEEVEQAEDTVTNAMEAVEAAHDVVAVLAAAPPVVKVALIRMYLRQEPVNDVAAALKVSRFALGRRVAAFAEEMQAAA